MNNPLLRELGVEADTLSDGEKDSLRRDGYLILGQLLTENDLIEIRSRLAHLLEEEGGRAGAELALSPTIRYPQEAGADRLADLVNKGAVFDRFYTHPRVLAAVATVLGQDFKLSSLNFRAAKPGTGEQKLHVDWRQPVQDVQFLVCNSIWLLDDFTQKNGATRLVPGSHLDGRLPEEALDDPWAKHPNELLIVAPAGTVVIFNAHAWHGGTRNLTNAPRRAIHSYFCRADQQQQLDQRKLLKPSTKQRLSAAALKVLLG
jgi:hypothetical protein